MARDAPELTSFLTIVGRVCQARALAVWVPVDDELQLVGDWQLEHPLYDLLRTTWTQVADELSAGRRLTLGVEVTLYPMLAREDGLIGVLQYVGAFPHAGARRHYLEESLTALARMLSKDRPASVQARRVLPHVALDLDGPAETLDRRAYAVWLERCGWDVTQASAILGITRQALYDRLESMGLTRTDVRGRLDESKG
jgi:Bacterial regulatory protein, Fis family